MLKKVITILLIISMLLALGACSLGGDVTTVDTSLSSDTVDNIDSATSESVSESAETSETDTSETDTSEIDTSEVDTSETDTSEIDTSEVDTSEVDTSEIDTSELVSSDKTQELLTPTQYSGVYNGSEITMTLTLTEYNFSLCQFVHSCFVNGYITVCYHGKSGEENVCQARTLIDKNGKMVVEPIYDLVDSVSPEGKVVAYLADNEADRGKYTENCKPYVIDLNNNTISEITESATEKYSFWEDYFIKSEINPEYSIELTKDGYYKDYTLIDKYGNEYYTFKDVFSAHFISDDIILCRWIKDDDIVMALFDVNGNRISLEAENIGSFEDGLAAFVADGKLGIISDKGEIIIPAQIEVQDHFSAFYPGLFLNEGLVLVDIDGIFGIIEIERK